MLGLLIAFTFSGASSRFDTRRQLIVEEADAIGTAYLRVDLFPAEASAGAAGHFRRYLDARLGDIPEVSGRWGGESIFAQVKYLQVNLAAGGCGQPGGKRSAGAPIAATCAERDD